MKKFLLVGLTLSLALTACSAISPEEEVESVQDGVVTIFAEDG